MWQQNATSPRNYPVQDSVERGWLPTCGPNLKLSPMACTAGARPAAERPRVPSLGLRGPALQAPLSHGPVREKVQSYT